MVIGFDASRAFVREPTGTENYSQRLFLAMAREFPKDQFIAFLRSPVEKEKLVSLPNVTYRVIGWPRLWTQGGLGWRTFGEKMDVLFVPAHTLPVVRRPGLATVVTIHGLEYEYLPQHYRFPQRLYLTWSTRYAVSAATRVVAVSSFTAEELVRRFGTQRKKISVVPEGVDIQVYRKSYSDSEKNSLLEFFGIASPYVLFVGVVQPRKNLERLVEAFAALVRKLEESGNRELASRLQLIVAGKLGWMYEGILAAPRRFGVEERVKFVRFVEEKWMPILLQQAKLLVLPSLTEGFGLPALEAMAAGTPVVAANAGALPEVVGNAGVLVDPLSVESIAGAMFQVLTQPGLGKQLREKGLFWCRRFSWERAATETMVVLRGAAGKAEGRGLRVEGGGKIYDL